jgi:hypothetical protein
LLIKSVPKARALALPTWLGIARRLRDPLETEEAFEPSDDEHFAP